MELTQGQKWVTNGLSILRLFVFWHHFHCILYLDVVRKRFIIVPLIKWWLSGAAHRTALSHKMKTQILFWSATVSFTVKSKLPQFLSARSGKDTDWREENYVYLLIIKKTFSTYYHSPQEHCVTKRSPAPVAAFRQKMHFYKGDFVNCEHISWCSLLTVGALAPTHTH